MHVVQVKWNPLTVEASISYIGTYNVHQQKLPSAPQCGCYIYIFLLHVLHEPAAHMHYFRIMSLILIGYVKISPNVKIIRKIISYWGSLRLAPHLREVQPTCLSLSIYIYIYILAEKSAFGGLHCYGASSTAALRRRSDDCASMTEPWWHHNGACRLLAKECARRARGSLLSLCWASSWRRVCFAAGTRAEIPLRAVL